ncbi:MAG: sulfatase-like hydrolase/transferase [Bacteroidetes bacterium]|nr:sulfatase-like hydrolase/transferase [Bacteroidota bacterium]
MKSTFLVTIGALALTNQSVLADKKSENSPNVIIILADDQGYGGVNCYPHNKRVITPNIDKLAESGVKFTQAYTSGHVCSPTRAGLMTGKYQQSFGFYGLSEPHVGGIPKTEKILPQYLKEYGYTTGLVGKWHLGDYERNYPINMGFDYFYGFIEGQHDYFNPVVGHSWEGGSNGLAFMMEDKEPVAAMKYSTFEFTDKAVEYIKKNAYKPFFLYLAYNAIHAPLEAPDDLLKKYADNPDKPNRDDVVRAMTVALDDGVGQVVETLKKLKLSENTIIFYLSDNGGATFSDNWDLRGSKGSYYEGGIRVPFIVSWPGQLPAGKTISNPVISIDIAPTILGILSEKQNVMNGVNLLPYLKGEKTEAPHDILFWGVGKKGETPEKNEFAVRQGKWKLVSDPRLVKDCNLYDIEADPSEKYGLRQKYPEKFDELYKIYMNWINQMPASLVNDDNRRLNGNDLIKDYEQKGGKKRSVVPGGYEVKSKSKGW